MEGGVWFKTGLFSFSLWEILVSNLGFGKTLWMIEHKIGIPQLHNKTIQMKVPTVDVKASVLLIERVIHQ